MKFYFELMSENQKHPGGRPTKYKQEYCEKLIQHMAEGYSFESFAGVVEVNVDTLHEWAKVHEEFSDSKKIAFAKCQMFWERIGITNILNISESLGPGMSSSKSLNASAWIFNMKNRFKWRDKQPDETEVVVNNVNTMSEAEIDSKINKLMESK